jgi:hypothetical protein
MWVKNVNNLRIQSGIKGVVLSPIYKLSIHCVGIVYGKLQVVQYIIHTNTVLFSTYVFYKFNLLNTVYPHYPQGLLLEPIKKI